MAYAYGIVKHIVLALNVVGTKKGWMSPADPNGMLIMVVVAEDRKENAPY